MTDTGSHGKVRARDLDLRRRAARVIPGGMYGHMTVGHLPAAHPQFYERSKGSHVWDVDGNEYVDFMCSFGPMILGYQHPPVEAAAQAQRDKGDTQPGPSPVMVDLAELLVERIAHASWAIFAKNGTDATTVALMVARAQTNRNRVLAAAGAYHGSAPWANFRREGVAPEEQANLYYYQFNDAASVERAIEEAGAANIAAIIASPFKHDAGLDQEEVHPAFARRLRQLCDELGAALVLDEVRSGFRLNHGGSWEPLGVHPDLSAWSKAIANGYPIAAILGGSAYAEAATRIFVTGSFWFQAVPMAAAIATILALREQDAVTTMERVGHRLRRGLDELARNAGVPINQSGPVQIPNVSFPGDRDFAKASAFSAAMHERGVIIHPRHNWFLSAAHTEADVDRFLEAAEDGLQVIVQSERTEPGPASSS